MSNEFNTTRVTEGEKIIYRSVGNTALVQGSLTSIVFSIQQDDAGPEWWPGFHSPKRSFGIQDKMIIKKITIAEGFELTGIFHGATNLLPKRSLECVEGVSAKHLASGAPQPMFKIDPVGLELIIRVENRHLPRAVPWAQIEGVPLK